MSNFERFPPIILASIGWGFIICAFGGVIRLRPDAPHLAVVMTCIVIVAATLVALAPWRSETKAPEAGE